MHNKEFYFEPEESSLPVSLNEHSEFFQDALPASCAQSAAALAAFFDGEATPDETRRATLHLQRCEACRVLLKGWRQSREVLLSMPPLQAPPTLLPRILLALRLVAMRDSLHRTARPAHDSPHFEEATSQLMQNILQATSAPSAVVEMPRKASIGRGAGRGFALALSVCVIAAALSTQNVPQQEFSTQGRTSIAPPSTGDLRVASSTTDPRNVLKNGRERNAGVTGNTRSMPAYTFIKNGAHAAVTKLRELSSDLTAQDAPAHNLTRTSPSAPTRRSSDEPLSHRDEGLETAAVEAAALPQRASSVFVNLEIRNPRRAAVTAHEGSEMHVVKTGSFSASRARAFAFAPRLMTGTRSDEAHDRIARSGAATLKVSLPSALSPAAPRMTRPDSLLPRDVAAGGSVASSRSAERLAHATRAVLATLPRSVSSPSFEEDEDSSGTESDALDDLRATTNSYRAALDAENDGDDAT